MRQYRLTLQPRSAFGTPLVGDTLFGQLCWTVRHQLGNERLEALLQGYEQGRPYAVLGDALPQGYLPLPSLPTRFWAESALDRKVLKKKRWLPLQFQSNPLVEWQGLAHSDLEATQAIAGEQASSVLERAQPHNTINRLTGTTGTGQFAPYSQSNLWFDPGMCFDIYVCLDTERMTPDEFLGAVTMVGQNGYGRDASIGMGKFDVLGIQADTLVFDHASTAWLTLGPCAPQGQGFDSDNSYYQPMTRFGRHGDQAVQSGNPFKRPVLMARTGAVFTPMQPLHDVKFIGQGLTGVSTSQPHTVQQGYAPVVGLCLASA